MDQTEELDEDGVKLYQSLIGALQWLITLGRFDIQQAVRSLSSFRAMPREGHLERLKRVFGYLKRTKTGAIRFRTGIPGHEVRTEENGDDWSYLVYGDVQEEILEDAPRSLGANLNNIVCRCKFDALSRDRAVHVWRSTLLESDTSHVVCQETRHCGDSNLWLGICGGSNLRWSDCQSKVQLANVGGTTRWSFLDAWG